MSEYKYFQNIPDIFHLKKDMMDKGDFSKAQWDMIADIISNKVNVQISNNNKKNKETVMTWIRETAFNHNKANPTDLLMSASVKQLLVDYNEDYDRLQRRIDRDLDDSNISTAATQQSGFNQNGIQQNKPPLVPPIDFGNLSKVDFLSQARNGEDLCNDTSYISTDISGNNGNTSNNNGGLPYSEDLNTNTGQTPAKIKMQKNAFRTEMNRSKLMELSDQIRALRSDVTYNLERIEFQISEAMRFTSGTAAHQTNENDKLQKQISNLNKENEIKLNDLNKKLKRKEREIEALKLEATHLRPSKIDFEEDKEEISEKKLEMDVDGKDSAPNISALTTKTKMKDLFKKQSEQKMDSSAKTLDSLLNYDIDEKDKGRVIKLSLRDSQTYNLPDYTRGVMDKLIEAGIDGNRYIETKDEDLRIKICPLAGGRRIARIYFCDHLGVDTAIEMLRNVGCYAGHWKNSNDIAKEAARRRHQRQNFHNGAHFNNNNAISAMENTSNFIREIGGYTDPNAPRPRHVNNGRFTGKYNLRNSYRDNGKGGYYKNRR